MHKQTHKQCINYARQARSFVTSGLSKVQRPKTSTEEPSELHFMECSLPFVCTEHVNMDGTDEREHDNTCTQVRENTARGHTIRKTTQKTEKGSYFTAGRRRG